MTAREAIIRAMRMLRILGAGRSPTSAEAQDLLGLLQSLCLSLPGATHWRDVETSEAYTAGENERIWVPSDGAAVAITLPTSVTPEVRVLYECDYYSIVCTGEEGRAPKDGVRVQVSGGETFMYRADRREWMQASSLTLNSVLPVNADLEDGLCALLAVRASDEFGKVVGPGTALQASEAESRMLARYCYRPKIGVEPTLMISPWSGVASVTR